MHYTIFMYIKKVTKRNKGSDTAYVYFHLVENVRTPAGPRQRLVLNLGSLDILPEQFKELANCIEGILLGQPSLFSPDAKIEKLAKNAVKRIFSKASTSAASEQQPEFAQVDVSSFEASEIRTLGSEHVCHSIWQELKLSEKLLELGVSRHVIPTIEMLVAGRLIAPGSERHTHAWAQQISAIFELAGNPIKPSLSSLYRAGDLLFSHKDALEAHLSLLERDLFSLQEKICFFDLTNTYFEGEMLNNSKAKRGRSKEKRSDCKLLTLALIIDADGFAKYSQVFDGNQYEGKTLATMIESLEKLRPDLAGDRTVVMDAGIATADNLAYLQKRNWKYIVVNRGSDPFELDDLKKMKVIRTDQQGDIQVEVMRREEPIEVLLLCRSKGRRDKENSMRSYQEKAFLERLEYYRQGLSKKGHTKKYSKILEMIGRTREKYPSASKLYDVEVTLAETEKGKAVEAKNIVWNKRTGKEQEASWDGCYVLRTNRRDLKDQEIWETYIMLTKIESAFRTLKTSLGLRPNFHQKEQRADAHLFISVLAYHILHAIEWKLQKHGDHRNWETIRQILSTHHRLTLEFQEKSQHGIEQKFLRMCSRPEPEQKMIYHSLGIKEVPLPRKSLAGSKISSDEKKQDHAFKCPSQLP